MQIPLDVIGCIAQYINLESLINLDSLNKSIRNYFDRFPLAIKYNFIPKKNIKLDEIIKLSNYAFSLYHGFTILEINNKISYKNFKKIIHFMQVQCIKIDKNLCALLVKNRKFDILNNLYYIDLSKSYIKNVSNLGNVRTLDLSRTGVVDVSELGNVNILNLSATKVTDVSNLGNLHTLDLSETIVTNVTNLGNLHTLDLSYTEVTDVGNLGNLHTLDLS